MTLKEIIENKRYPILFIGAGISKRYLKGYPNWKELLHEYYSILELEQPYFSYLNDLKKKYSNKDLEDNEISFHINTEAATFIESQFNEGFYNEKIIVPNLTPEEAYDKGISAFKVSVSQKFSQYDYVDNVDKEEINSLRRFLKKARMIITTNYDGFIEDLLSDDEKGKPVVYVGQDGFFEETIGWSEVYKIHGDYNRPSSIIINKEDYDQYDKNSVLISAKVLSTMIYSPIIFLGYSLNDRNVRKLLSDFTSQLPKEDERKKMSRITVIEREKGLQDIEEFMQRMDQDEFGYSVIKTDNYKKIYDEIGKINLGLTPIEVLKYQQFVKNIVVSAEQRGALDTVLVTPTELSDVEKDFNEGKHVVVALGNRKNMLVFPDLLTYIHDYLFEEDLSIDQIIINLKFVANDGQRNTRIPFIKYFKNNQVMESLDSITREKLENKRDNEKTFEDLKSSLPDSCKKIHNSIQDIINLSLTFTTEISMIIYNLENFDTAELDDYIHNTSFPQFEKLCSENPRSGNKTHYRKLFKAYDFICNGNFD